MAETYASLDARLSRISHAELDKRKGNFKYPGSVQLYRTACTEHYRERGISDPEVIGRLIDNDIIPYLVLGSTSQGEHRHDSDFCLDGFFRVGITSPDDMLLLAGCNVGPYDIRCLLRELNADNADNEMAKLISDGLGGKPLKRKERGNALIDAYEEGRFGQRIDKWIERRLMSDPGYFRLRINPNGKGVVVVVDNFHPSWQMAAKKLLEGRVNRLIDNYASGVSEWSRLQIELKFDEEYGLSTVQFDRRSGMSLDAEKKEYSSHGIRTAQKVGALSAVMTYYTGWLRHTIKVLKS